MVDCESNGLSVCGMRSDWREGSGNGPWAMTDTARGERRAGEANESAKRVSADQLRLATYCYGCCRGGHGDAEWRRAQEGGRGGQLPARCSSRAAASRSTGAIRLHSFGNALGRPVHEVTDLICAAWWRVSTARLSSNGRRPRRRRHRRREHGARGEGARGRRTYRR